MGKSKVNEFKIFLIRNGISNSELSVKAGISMATLYLMLNKNIWTEESVFIIHRCLSKIYGMDITMQDIIDLLNTTN